MQVKALQNVLHVVHRMFFFLDSNEVRVSHGLMTCVFLCLDADLLSMPADDNNLSVSVPR